MAKALMMAWSSPASTESLAEFHRWYDEEHIPDIKAAVPSITIVDRYQLVDDDAPGRFLTIYQLDDGDVDKARAALYGAVDAGSVPVSDTLDRRSNPAVLQFYRNVRNPKG